MSFDGSWSEKHAVERLAVEIPLSLNLAIVLARRSVELNTDPISGGEVGSTQISYSGETAILELDSLSHCKG